MTLIKDIYTSAVIEFPIDQVLNEDKITPWLNAYQSLFKEFDLPPLWNTEEMHFYNLYSRLETLIEYYRLEELAQNALDEYNSGIDTKGYLSKYERLGNQLVLIDLDLDYILNSSLNYRYFIYNGIFVTVSGLGLKPQIDFKKLYWKLVSVIYPD